MKRFWNKTKRLGDCIVWTGCSTKAGYGRFFVGGKVYLAHRVSAWLAGKITKPAWSKDWSGSDFVCHSCDTQSCVNPDHLFIGTHQQNMDDRISKFGHPDVSGVNNPNAKHTKEQVLRIRSMYANGIKPSAISAKLMISLSTVEQIAYRKTFKGEQYVVER